MLKRISPTFLMVLVVILSLSACNLPGMPADGGSLDPNAMNTAVVQTVSAQQTQFAFDSLVQELTRVAQTTPDAGEAPSGGFTATPTSIPSMTLAPSQTLPPTQTLAPTSTAVPTLTAVPWTPTPIATNTIAVPCYRAQFISDVTIPDGTKMQANQSFTKTWRLKNSGSCNWTNEFDLVFDSGNAMSGPASQKLPATIRPGDSVDLSVSLKAPSSSGSYTGNWKLRSSNGVLFGLGANANNPFWVKIEVGDTDPGSWDSDHPRDFAYNYCQAAWTTSKGQIFCPSGEDNTSTGSVRRSKTPKLEGGYQEDEMAIIVAPNSGDGGYVRGLFPSLKIRDGDHFRTTVGCLDGAKDCDVTFRVGYVLEGETTNKNLGSWEEEYDGDWTTIDIDLSDLAGKRIQLYLRVNNNGSSKDDRVFWLVPVVFKP